MTTAPSRTLTSVMRLLLRMGNPGWLRRNTKRILSPPYTNVPLDVCTLHCFTLPHKKRASMVTLRTSPVQTFCGNASREKRVTMLVNAASDQRSSHANDPDWPQYGPDQPFSSSTERRYPSLLLFHTSSIFAVLPPHVEW